MKLLNFILFLAIIDFYFYLGTISIIHKLFKNPILYKILYWVLSITFYMFILYIIYTYRQGDSSKSLSFNNNNIVYTSLFFVLLISKLLGSLPLIIDIITIVNHIILLENSMSMLSPYSYYASDINEDDIINITDIVSVVSLIIDSVNE